MAIIVGRTACLLEFLRDNITNVSDPFIRSKSTRQNLGSTRFASGKQAAAKSGTPTDVQVAEAYLKSSGPGGTREKLNNFLSKLETTWKLFNRSSTDSPDGELPKDGSLALLSEGETPTPETLKLLRQRFKQSAQKPQKGGTESLYKNATPERKESFQKKASKGPDQGPKPSPNSDRNTPKPPTQRAKPPAPQPRAQKLPPKPAPKQSQKPPASKPSAEQSQARQQTEAKNESKARTSQRFEGPTVERRPLPEMPAKRQSSGKKSVLGRRPGSTSNSAPKSKPSNNAPPESRQSQDSHMTRKAPTQKASQAPRQPQLLRRPGARGPAGAPTSRSFLGTTSSSAQLRNSDASGRPGTASHSTPARQAVYSQSVAQVNPRLKKRQVSSQMPVHNSFLDECHEESADSGPIRLSWQGGKKTARTPAQRLFAHRRRLQLSRRGGSGNGTGKNMGPPLSLKMGAHALSAARTDVSTRIAGAAIGSLLEDLYEEEDVENLDEETAVTSLGLILRLGGEFTYEHSTRVLDLALELADEVGIRDKQTRKEIKFGTMLRDVGEFDLLLQGSPDAAERMKEFSGFLAGQDMLRAGLLHDIGKVQIPPEILYKPGKLTPEEYEIMKMHPIYGEEIVKPIASLRYLCPTIRGHHERWDGKGYPDGLTGDSIPLAARIISVADVFDALAAERPYKRGMEVGKVKAILAEGRGSHFDPFLVDAFLEVLGRRYPT